LTACVKGKAWLAKVKHMLCVVPVPDDHTVVQSHPIGAQKASNEVAVYATPPPPNQNFFLTKPKRGVFKANDSSGMVICSYRWQHGQFTIISLWSNAVISIGVCKGKFQCRHEMGNTLGDQQIVALLR
jgi:hypothetical protein